MAITMVVLGGAGCKKEEPSAPRAAGASAAVTTPTAAPSDRTAVAGKTRWKLEAPGGVVAPAVIAPGEPIAYVVSKGSETRELKGDEYHFQWKGMLHAVDLQTGKARWSTPLVGLMVNRPLVEGDAVYVVGNPFCDLRHKAGEGCAHTCARESKTFVYAVERNDGKVRWTKELVGVSLAFVSGGVVYLPGHDSLVTLDAKTGEPTTAPPSAEAKSRLAILEGENRKWGLVAYKVADRSKWEPKIPDFEAEKVNVAPLVTPERVFLPSDMGVLWVAAADGTLAWKREELPMGLRTPTVDGNTVFLSGEGNTVVALDAATGKDRWKVQLPSRVTGPLAVAGGKLFVPGERSLLVLDAASGRQTVSAQVGTIDGSAPAVTTLAGRPLALVGTTKPAGLVAVE